MNALITGSSSGIGEAIVKELRSKGYKIIPFRSRLEDINSLKREAEAIKEPLDVLIHSAGFGLFGPLENLHITQIEKLIRVNLIAPITLTSLLLRKLKQSKGHIISISSIEALKHSKFSSVYTASKAGLRAFSLSLFEEVRKSGVRVTNINPDITKTPFFDDLHFEPSDKKDSFLTPLDIANMVVQALEFNGNVSELTLRPQRFEINKKPQL
ncbi:MAG: short-chain dehydrogenase [Proteobacteria bacterium]|nr:MAG: short-chain dehydrogenase [Pseudomonadota bacterium]